MPGYVPIMRWLLLLLLIPFSAHAETWTGHPRIVDGDTIVLDQGRVRLLNVDAFETAQNCTRDSVEYACGAEATRALNALVAGREVRCEGDRLDRYRRLLAHCYIGDLDLGREMVRSGWAIVATGYGEEYRAVESEARADRAGAWAGEFQDPARFRHYPKARFP